jgi:diguanylate cyclase (GGDEF)-like protein
MEAIQRVAAIVSGTLDSDEALRRIVETLASVFGFPFVAISLIDGDRLDSAAWHGTPLGKLPPPLVIGEGVAGRVAQTGKAELATRFSEIDERSLALPDSTSQIAVPIACDGALAGVLTVEGNPLRPLTAYDLEYLQTFAAHAGTTLTNARHHERVLELAMRDPITNLPNYRQFQNRLHAELARADRHDRPLALIVIDLDGFKSINDAFGHIAGDDILREIGARLTTTLRESDVLARYAGDEFVVILPETSREIAGQIAERLQLAIETQPFAVVTGEDVVVSISVGVASYPVDAATIDALISAADSAMYQTKRRRRVATSLPSA